LVVLIFPRAPLDYLRQCCFEVTHDSVKKDS
jgi:hypothetical protein